MSLALHYFGRKQNVDLTFKRFNPENNSINILHQDQY